MELWTKSRILVGRVHNSWTSPKRVGLNKSMSISLKMSMIPCPKKIHSIKHHLHLAKMRMNMSFHDINSCFHVFSSIISTKSECCDNFNCRPSQIGRNIWCCNSEKCDICVPHCLLFAGLGEEWIEFSGIWGGTVTTQTCVQVRAWTADGCLALNIVYYGKPPQPSGRKNDKSIEKVVFNKHRCHQQVPNGR